MSAKMKGKSTKKALSKAFAVIEQHDMKLSMIDGFSQRERARFLRSFRAPTSESRKPTAEQQGTF